MNLSKKFKEITTFAKQCGQSRGPYRHSFHRSIFPVLFVTQLFGFFPVQGISALHTHHLRFKWISLRTLYSSVIIVLGLTIAILEMIRLSTTTASVKNLG